MSLFNYVSAYIRAGFSVCPVAPRSKRTVHKDWPNTDSARAIQLFQANPDYNIGVGLGDASGGIVDIDLDAPAAVQLATAIFPRTDLRFGRPGKPNSHWIYRVSQPGRTKQFQHPKTNAMLIEYRANGAMTVFPPSVHQETGELIEFEGDPGEASETDREELLRRCSLVAIASVVVERWAPGSRHRLALALAGLLGTSGVDRDNAIRLMEAITAVASDDEVEDRLDCIRTTYDRLQGGETVEFRGTLDDLLGARIVQAFYSWLRRKPAEVAKPVALADAAGKRGPCLDRPGTDVEAAQEFAEAVSDRLIFADGLKQWFASNNHVFEPVTSERVTGLSMKFVTEIAAQANSVVLLPQIRTLFSHNRIKSVIALSKPQLRCDHISFDKNPWLAGCHGGILDLRTGELVKPPDIVTKRLGTALPISSASGLRIRILGRRRRSGLDRV